MQSLSICTLVARFKQQEATQDEINSRCYGLVCAGRADLAFELVVRCYGADFSRVLRTRNGDHAECESRFYIQLRRALVGYQNRGSVRGFALRIARCVVITMGRKSSREVPLADSRELPWNPPSAQKITYRTQGGRGPCTRLMAVATPLEAEVFRRLLDGKKPQEIAAELGVKTQKVYDAKRRLQERGRKIPRWRECSADAT